MLLEEPVFNPIEFIEIGCDNNAADLIGPMIEAGKRGIFIDANQNALKRRRKSLRENPKSNIDHMFICCLVNDDNRFSPFYATDFAYSSTSYNHVIGHVVADAVNSDSPQERKECKLSEINAVYMLSATLHDILKTCNIKNLPLLNIDCEGRDCLIISSTDFSYFQPEIICFEHGHSEEVFRGKGQNYENAVKHLESFGYKMINQNMNDTVMKRISASS
jgi:hypothetical protein